MRTAELEIRESEETGRLRLTLFGELDLASSPFLEQRLGELRGDRRPVLMDLSRLEFMDSTGLGVMIRALRSASNEDWQFSIDPRLAPQARRLFGLVALNQFVDPDGTPG